MLPGELSTLNIWEEEGTLSINISGFPLLRTKSVSGSLSFKQGDWQ